ncbi:glutamate receptor ionotropic, NMDA 1-like [Montipora capricornis]|uniref:glutamate receptor ionotropic, NMDA 1-like n=1 Tax=Montipora foliosa TaxID=591990 RepID=UPI0035F10F10
MSVSQRTLLTVIIILVLDYALSDDNCNEERPSSLTVLGVFDLNDTNSVLGFENAISLHNSQWEEHCVPRLTSSKVFVKNEMSVNELIDLVGSVLNNGACFMVYGSQSREKKIVLDLVRGRAINIITAVREFYEQPPFEEVTYNYDPVTVASMNRTTSIETKINALLSFLNEIKWGKFVVVSDNDYQSVGFVSLLQEHLPPRNMRITEWLVFSGDDTFEDIFYRFQTLSDGVTTFLLVTNNLKVSLNTFMGAAEASIQVDTWVVVSDLHVATFHYSLFPPTDVFSLTPKTTKEIPISAFVEDAVRAVSLALSKRPRSKGYSCPRMKEMRRLLSDIDFHGSSGPVQLDSMGNRVPLGYDVYMMVTQEKGADPPTLIHQLGYWHNGKLYITNQNEMPTLKILVNEYPPNVMSQPKIPGEPCHSNSMPCTKTIDTPNGKTDIVLCCYGFVVDVVQMVVIEHAFVPELVFCSDGQYGVYDEVNNTWNGVVSELLNGRGDVSFDLYISSRRAAVVDFTEPYMPSGIRLLAKERESLDNEIAWLSYLRPFTTPVWLTLLGSLGFMIIFLWGVDKISPVRASKKLFHKNSAFKLDNAVCYALALAFGRPADEAKPSTNGARLSSVAFGMAMLVFVSTYSANLAAFLIVEDKTTPVKDIYDLKIERPPEGFKYGTIEGSYMADYFKNSENTYFRHIWYHMRDNNVKSLSEGVQAARTGKLDVFIADYVGLEYESVNDPYCELKVVGDPFAMSGASVAVKKGSQLFKPLSEALQKIKAKGLTDFIERFWVKKFSCTRDIPPAQLKLEDLSGLFLQLTIAIVACIAGNVFHGIFLYARERWKQKKTEDREELRCRFSQAETLV